MASRAWVAMALCTLASKVSITLQFLLGVPDTPRIDLEGKINAATALLTGGSSPQPMSPAFLVAASSLLSLEGRADLEGSPFHCN